MNGIKSAAQKLLRLVYPPHCPYCGCALKKPEPSCPDCADKLTYQPIVRQVYADIICCSPFPYSGIYSEAIKRFKFRGKTSYSYPLSCAVADVLKRLDATEFDFVTCVPLHPKDRRLRGYNQAELLARDCAGLLGVEYADLLEKRRRNLPQHTVKSYSGKRVNVRGVFRVKSNADIKGKRILLIDDVITSGSTLHSSCQELIFGGAGFTACATVCSVGGIKNGI